jgi:mRNA-degrading endonuclease RelE of RelBE toxin-antitoxin system
MKRRPKRPSSLPPVVERAHAKPGFELRYTADAARDIKSFDVSIRSQLRKVLEKKLAIDPEGYGLPLRSPLANYWKHEFRNHRIIYRIYPDHRVVAVCAVGIRKQGDVEDIYRKLESIALTGRLAGQLAASLKNLMPNK